MRTKSYFVGAMVVVEWPLTLLDGTAVADATVNGEVTYVVAGLPTTAAMAVTSPATGSGDPYRLTYEPSVDGMYAYRVTADGSVDDAEEGTFVVLPSLLPAPTIVTDPTTPGGLVRLLISDVDPAKPVFSDLEIAAFLAMVGSNVRLAAAQALDVMASNESMVSKVIRTLDLQIDGTKVAADLRAGAKVLRDQAADYLPDGTLFGMGIVDYYPWWCGPELAEPECAIGIWP